MTTRTSAGPFDAQFASTVSPHLRRMHVAARRVLHRPDLADDVVQDVLIRVWSNRRLPENPAEGLAGLSHLGALSARRTQNRRAQHENAAAHLCSPQCPCREPLAELESSETRATILAAVDALPEQQRAVFVAFELNGDDYASIAAQLQIPVGTVRSRLARARRALRSSLTSLEAAA